MLWETLYCDWCFIQDRTSQLPKVHCFILFTQDRCNCVDLQPCFILAVTFNVFRMIHPVLHPLHHTALLFQNSLSNQHLEFFSIRSTVSTLVVNFSDEEPRFRYRLLCQHVGKCQFHRSRCCGAPVWDGGKWNHVTVNRVKVTDRTCDGTRQNHEVQELCSHRER